MLSIRRLTVIVLLVAVALGLGRPALAQSDGEYFSETGHWVRGPFLAGFESAEDPMLIFGNPITDQFDSRSEAGVKIQYFQRARMEYSVTGKDAGVVRLAPLGTYLYDENRNSEPYDLPYNPGACRKFNNGISVCYAFMQFYEAHEGETFFGLPVSPVIQQDGRLVQYFEFARMEWRPEEPSGKRVGLTNIGQLAFDIFEGNPGLTGISATDAGLNAPQAGQITDLTVRAFAAKPLVTSDDNQILYVIVQDQVLRPIEGVFVKVTLHFANDVTIDYNMPVTNADGISQITFPVGTLKPNQIVWVEVYANIPDGLSKTTETWYRSWW